MASDRANRDPGKWLMLYKPRKKRVRRVFPGPAADLILYMPVVMISW